MNGLRALPNEIKEPDKAPLKTSMRASGISNANKLNRPYPAGGRNIKHAIADQ